MTVQFSIVTPSFNGFRHIRRCAGSVRGQKGAAFEHIVRDGGSTDGTVEWLRTQSDLSFVSEKDGGMYDAINRGWAVARGEILSWLNTDEQYLPGTLETVAQVFRARPETDAVFGNMIVVGPDGSPLAARREIPMRAIYLRNRFLYAFSCTLFFHRRLLDRGGLVFNTRYRYAGDYDLMLRLVNAGLRIVHIPRYLSLFGVDGANLSTSPRSLEEAEAMRREYGAFRSKLARQAVALARNIERLAAGCYRRDELTYDFALDEIPTYKRFEKIPAGYRFLYDDIAKRLQKAPGFQSMEKP